MTTATALPFVMLPMIPGSPIQLFGLILLMGVGLGALTTVILGKRSGLATRDLGLIVPAAIATAIVGAHWFDVIVYQWDRASEEPGLWLQVIQGMSLFGALVGVSATVLAVAAARDLDRRIWADVVAVGCLVAMTIGRIGCALVHDHPGLPTDSVIGIDTPAVYLQFAFDELPVQAGSVIRVHDLGFEELLLLVPLTGVAFALLQRRLAAGTTAAIGAIIYGCGRFGLDFLRLPKTEPQLAGLTVGQWCCIVLVGLGVLGLFSIRRTTPP